MTGHEVLADSVLACKPLMTRYLVGFTDSNHTTQAHLLPNHAAWTLGHCAMTMHRVAEKLDGKPAPESDFIVGATKGDAARFGTETVAFNSRPTHERTLYPTLSLSIAIYESAYDRLGAAVRAATDETLTKPVTWGTGQTTISALVMRMVFHNGMHCGQIADLRRALEMKSIFA